MFRHFIFILLAVWGLAAGLRSGELAAPAEPERWTVWELRTAALTRLDRQCEVLVNGVISGEDTLDRLVTLPRTIAPTISFLLRLPLERFDLERPVRVLRLTRAGEAEGPQGIWLPIRHFPDLRDGLERGDRWAAALTKVPGQADVLHLTLPSGADAYLAAPPARRDPETNELIVPPGAALGLTPAAARVVAAYCAAASAEPLHPETGQPAVSWRLDCRRLTNEEPDWTQWLTLAGPELPADMPPAGRLLAGLPAALSRELKNADLEDLRFDLRFGENALILTAELTARPNSPTAQAWTALAAANDTAAGPPTALIPAGTALQLGAANLKVLWPHLDRMLTGIFAPGDESPWPELPALVGTEAGGGLRWTPDGYEMSARLRSSRDEAAGRELAARPGPNFAALAADNGEWFLAWGQNATSLAERQRDAAIRIPGPAPVGAKPAMADPTPGGALAPALARLPAHRLIVGALYPIEFMQVGAGLALQMSAQRGAPPEIIKLLNSRLSELGSSRSPILLGLETRPRRLVVCAAIPTSAVREIPAAFNRLLKAVDEMHAHYREFLRFYLPQ